MVTPGRSRRRSIGVVVLLGVLLLSGLSAPLLASVPASGGAHPSARNHLAFSFGSGISPAGELAAVYNNRTDLQLAYPDALTDSAVYEQLIAWANGTVSGAWVDSAYPSLAPFGYWYVLMAAYDARPDLQSAFPNALTDFSSYTSLVSWAGGVVSGASSDGAYAALAPYGYWYALMTTYNERPDLQFAYPAVYTNLSNFTQLVVWANGVVAGDWADGAYASLASFGPWYAVMASYSERPDLQTAFPDAFTNQTNFTELVGWAYDVVTGISADAAYPSLAPFGYWYALMSWYDDRSDLQSAFPVAFTDFGSYTGLVAWAAGVVSGASPDGAESALQPFGYYYSVMAVYNYRADLQAVFPDAYTNFADYTQLVQWAGSVVTGVFTDGADAILSPYGYFYDLMNIYDARIDLLDAFPNAFTNWGSGEALFEWAGEVVNESVSDASQATLEPFGYWYILFGWVYEQRPDLQTEFPLGLTIGASNQGLLGWADSVVTTDSPPDPAYTTLLPFASEYTTLA
jgi:hypothetical protein